MSLIAIRAVEQPINYGQLRALVVDDFPGMRSALKMTLSNFGMAKIDLCGSAAEAIFKVQNSHYDVILCDFNLGEGRDGQQLLEELRHRGLIQLKTVFVMVTAESVYEKVVATAELAPDDYMLKPFSAEVMRNRLEIILQRKKAFESIYRHHENNDLESAIAACDRLIQEKPKFLVDALRFKGESLNALGRFEEAEALYKQIIQMRAIPWARLGLAKSLHQQNKEEEAEALLHSLLEETPELVAAYDLLAEVRLAGKDETGAQAALEAGVGISARTVRRQQKLGNLAMDNGDLDTARSAYSSAIEKGRHSVFITPNDYGNLCRVQVEQGDLNAATDTLKKGKLALQSNPEGQLVSAIVQSLVHTRNGNDYEAGRTLDEAARLRAEGARVDGPLLLDLANSCLAQGRDEEADAIIAEVARNAHDSETMLAKAKKLYEEAGRAEAGARVLSEATSDVRKLNNEGVMLAHKGDFTTAVERLLNACELAPYNPRILMNGIWVILKSIDQAGMDEEKLHKARALLAEVERQSPGHGRLTGLRTHMNDIESRFGIRRRTA
jgi:DNA-binding response OmpR family regulator/Tfp pilus assembly protein PilF